MGNQFIMPSKVIYGENALENAKEFIAAFGKQAGNRHTWLFRY